jgi:hypothetical protein
MTMVHDARPSVGTGGSALSRLSRPRGCLMKKLLAGTLVMLASLTAFTLGGCAASSQYPLTNEGAAAPNASPASASGRLPRDPGIAPERSAVSSGLPLP